YLAACRGWSWRGGFWMRRSMMNGTAGDPAAERAGWHWLRSAVWNSGPSALIQGPWGVVDHQVSHQSHDFPWNGGVGDGGGLCEHAGPTIIVSKKAMKQTHQHLFTSSIFSRLLERRKIGYRAVRRNESAGTRRTPKAIARFV